MSQPSRAGEGTAGRVQRVIGQTNVIVRYRKTLTPVWEYTNVVVFVQDSAAGARRSGCPTRSRANESERLRRMTVAARIKAALAKADLPALLRCSPAAIVKPADLPFYRVKVE